MGKRPAFSVAGIPVAIHPAFFAVILVLGIVYLATPLYLVTWVAIATVSILLHEFGHAVAFRMYGLRPSVALVGFGGLTSADSADPGADSFTPARHIVVSLAGPLSAIVLLGLPALLLAEANGFDPWTSLGLRRSLDPAEIILGQIVYINVGWSLLNLLPVLPLDGGNVVAAVFEIFAKDKGRRIANVVSIAIAVVVALWAMSIGYTLAPIMALFLVGINVSELTKARSEDADRELGDALRSIIRYDPVQAEQLARRVLAGRPSPERAAWATELTAWARLAQGRPRDRPPPRRHDAVGRFAQRRRSAGPWPWPRAAPPRASPRWRGPSSTTRSWGPRPWARSPSPRPARSTPSSTSCCSWARPGCRAPARSRTCWPTAATRPKRTASTSSWPSPPVPPSDAARAPSSAARVVRRRSGAPSCLDGRTEIMR